MNSLLKAMMLVAFMVSMIYRAFIVHPFEENRTTAMKVALETGYEMPIWKSTQTGFMFSNGCGWWSPDKLTEFSVNGTTQTIKVCEWVHWKQPRIAD